MGKLAIHSSVLMATLIQIDRWLHHPQKEMTLKMFKHLRQIFQLVNFQFVSRDLSSLMSLLEISILHLVILNLSGLMEMF